ncbi:MAG: DUF3450 family protein [Candidatus Brocadia sp.]|jgi:hypothetical protein
MKKELKTKNRNLSSVCHRYALMTLLVIFVACLFSARTASGAMTDVSVDSVRLALEKWVETRRIISQEKYDFELGREMISERIKLVEREIELLRGKIREAEESITETDKKRADLVAENEKYKEATALLIGMATGLETRIREFLKRLPDPICGRVKPLSQRLPENHGEVKLSLGERFQNILGILNEVNKFNREITVTSEVRKLPDGTSAEVTVLYIGIGQAYYINGSGDVAGIGTASPEGWVWVPVNEAAAEIKKAVAILKNEAVAAFVLLPIEIQ